MQRMDQYREEARSAQKKKKEKKGFFHSELWEYIRLIVLVVAAMLLLQNFVIINATIPSESMENTIMPGDRIFGNRLAYLSADPQRGEVVIFKFPDNEKEYFIKRIIGLPGETVEVRGGKVYIDGAEEPLDDSYCPQEPDGRGDGVWEVPENSYFMMGDNRNMSNDSRYWQNPYVSRDKILGKAVLRYWPLNKITLIKTED